MQSGDESPHSQNGFDLSRVRFVAMLLFALLFPQSADEAYRQLQTRLANVTALRVEVPGPWDRTITYEFDRPGRGRISAAGADFRTNGRLIYRTDWGGFEHRRATKADLRRIELPGFERFYIPQARVRPQGNLREIEIPSGKILAMNLEVEGRAVIVYLSKETGLPVGSGLLSDTPPYFECAYSKVELNAKVAPIQVPPIPTSAQVFARMNRAVAAHPSFDLALSKDGNAVYQRLRVTKAWRPVVPGFEAFTGAKPLGVPYGTATTGNRNGGCYVISLQGPRDRQWKLYVDPMDYLPHGYEAFVRGMRKASVWYAHEGVFR
jgi:hypothetical protein